MAEYESYNIYKALTVKQPYANDLVTVAYQEDGVNYGIKSIEVRNRNTHYRGDLLICSSAKPVYPYLISGAALGLVELYDVKRIEDFTEDDWLCTRIPIKKRAEIKSGYGWMMRNPRKVIEVPVKGQLGIDNIPFMEGEIIPYPQRIFLDKKGYYDIMKSVLDHENKQAGKV